jgi:hypothetical protein
VQSLKTITLQESTEYTTGKVAVVSGTVGTNAATIYFSNTAYKDASGSAVSFVTAHRLAFAASPFAYLDAGAAIGGGDNVLASRLNEVTLIDAREGGSATVYTTSGTASYRLVIYGT